MNKLMKSITLIGKKVLSTVLLSLCVTTGFGQHIFNVDPVQAAEIAAFMKQPSAVEGKCNAEVLGIVTTASEFSWDDINTWKNADGKVWADGATADYAPTVFGFGFKKNAPYNGGASWICLITNKDDDKWNPAIPGVADLKGNFILSNCNATTVKIANSQINTIKICMNNPTEDCYISTKRNSNLEQLDISGSAGKLRQIEAYKNQFRDETSLVADNLGEKVLIDWLFNTENNLYTFSTLPKHPVTGAIIKTGYKDQWLAAGGLPIGEYNEKEKIYEIKIGDDIDLSQEYDIDGKMTVYTWKNEDGETIVPSSATADGWFCFETDDFAGKTFRCELRNESYPLLALNTVWVKVVKEYSGTGIRNVDQEVVKVGPNPAENTLNIYTSGVKAVRIYSLTGLCVKNVSDVTNAIDISELAAGLYTVKVLTSNGEKVAKIIKK